MNSSIYLPVPTMIQPRTWACWYTSMQMVVSYHRKFGKRFGLTDPSEDPETRQMYEANQGIGGGPTMGGREERERIARKLGFTVGFVSLTDEGMWGLLKRTPVIYAGRWPGQLSGHWVVIVGLSGTTIAINNPASGLESWDYDFFIGKYLVQTADRPLVYVEW